MSNRISIMKIDYQKIMSDRKLFNETVYTPMSEALRLLDERQKDPMLMAKIEKLLQGNIPEVLRKNKSAVLCRQVATPNHESRMFIDISKEYNLLPVFFEYLDDKFTSNNSYKHSLGQLQIQKSESAKDGSHYLEKTNIIDFNMQDGKKLKEVTTLWNEPLVDFHKNLFATYGYDMKDLHFYDVSDWFNNNGQKAENYYVDFLTLFTCFGILFENFLSSPNSEGDFTRNIVLPSIEKVVNLTGVKPLILPIGPLEIETDGLWFHHLSKVKKNIKAY